MKNADLPAMAQSFSMSNEDCGTAMTHIVDFKPHIGLTKREMFAMAAMQGVLASGVWDEYKYVARVGVEMADALLAKLDETK